MQEDATAPVRDLIRGAGLRVTRPRVAVLSALAERPHADADTVASAARAGLGSVSTQAVYDVLHAFTAAGLVRRIEPAGSPARFEVRVGDNHHHVVCRGCGAIEDVDCAVGARPCLDTEDTGHGFVIDEAEVTYWGTCPACRNRPTTGGTHHG
jgi:Fur family ferric uptake transcriptional regulator